MGVWGVLLPIICTISLHLRLYIYWTVLRDCGNLRTRLLFAWQIVGLNIYVNGQCQWGFMGMSSYPHSKPLG